MNHRHLVLQLVLIIVALQTVAGVAHTEPIAANLLTTAESSSYKHTTRHRRVVDLLNRFAQLSPKIQVKSFGKTVEQRELLVAITGGVQSPAELKPDHLVVLVLANIHSGECAGKEALLMLLREMALQADHPLLKKLVILAVPNYNADANERLGRLHRPGQIGPQIMGRRENAQQLDLNRDFIKLDAPETRSLVKLVNQWSPHAFIDLHTTNGSQHRYDLTYDVAHNPAAPSGPVKLLRNQLLPEVTRRLARKKIPTFYYGNFNKSHTRWSTFGHEPRYSTEYMGMRGILAILSEAYSYVSYKRRIVASREFVRECIAAMQRRTQQVRRVVAETRRGKRPATISIQAKLAKFKAPVVVQGYAGSKGKRTNRDYQVEFWGRFQSIKQAKIPAAYLIPYDQSRVIDRLLMHGVRVHQLQRDVTARVELETQVKLRRGRVFQRHRLVTVTSQPKTVTRQLKAGTYVVPANQSLARLLVYMLEPSSDDGLALWNFLDHSLVNGGQFPVSRLLQPTTDLPLAAPLTKVDPAQRIDFENVYGRRRVPFSGSFLIASWQAKTAKYSRTWAGKRVLVDAHSGAMEPLPSRQDLVKALAKLRGIDRRRAASLARGRRKELPDGRSLLISGSNFIRYNPKTKTAQRLGRPKGRVRFATASRDGRYIAYVSNHNLWIMNTDTGKPKALTTDGDSNHFYGELDWVYQEELYGRGNFKAFWWSPDSQHIAFLKLDETPVRKYTVPDQIPYRQSLHVTNYPKSGDPLPKVELGVVNVDSGRIRLIKDREYAKEKDLLTVRVGWTPDGTNLVYQLQNRVQTWLDLRAVSPTGGSSKKLLRETSKAWVSILGQPRWLKDGSFLWLSERSGTKQLYRVFPSGKTQQLTRTRADVSAIAAVDPRQEWVYFHSYDHSPIAQQVYRVRLRDQLVQRLSKHDGHHVARFNDDCQYWICYRSGIHHGVKVELYKNDGSFVRSLGPNLTDHLQYYRVAKPQRFRVPTRDGKYLDAYLIKPADFDARKKYPVLCYVYSGPQAPTVQNRWSGSTYMWHQMLAQRGYCIWLCDNRSASRRGAQGAWPIHKNMGQQELEDIEDGLKWLKRNSWIDGQRIGIWGWSYGGYMTAYALTHSKSFKVGISGAPVTDWRNYDAIYTERYMGLPQTNKKGYESSSVISAAKNLSGRLLLVHGTQDDNVHLGNTLQLVYALQNAGKRFDLMLYPRNKHGVVRPRQFRHLRKLMTRFVLEEL